MSPTKTVLVTGASSGIGRATAVALARRGWRVYASVRKQTDADALAEDLGAAGEPVLMDISDGAAVRAAVASITARGPLDAVVNNAGVAVAAPLEFIPLDEFRRQIDVNLTAQLVVAQASLPALRASRGRLLFVGSIGGRVAGPMLGAYHASKFGLVGLTDSLRAELAPAGVRVILIEPGTVSTSIWSSGAATAQAIIERMPAEALQHYGATLRAMRSRSAAMGEKGLRPSEAAATLVRALETARPKPRYLLGRDAKALATLAYLPARLRARMVGSQLTADSRSDGNVGGVG